MKETYILSITPTESKVLTDFADYCDSKNNCGDCPFTTICDSAATSSLSMSEFMKGLLSKVVIKE